MLVHDKFVFLHVPKTGGTCLAQILKEQCVTASDLYPMFPHAPLGYLPKEHHHKRICAMIRNPWAWYVSHFYYMHQKLLKTKLTERLERIASHRTFNAFVHEGKSLTQTFEEIIDHPILQATILKYEDGLEAAFTAITGLASPPIPVINNTPHPPYQECFTREQRDKVAEREQGIITRFGYQFDE